VLATVNKGLEATFKARSKALAPIQFTLINGNIHGGADYPWWKYINRPVPKSEEVNLL